MQKTGKLELTWVGKYDDKVVEPRILVEDVDKSYGDPTSENMLIHGDNLIALQALQQDFAGRIKCIYIDPPYNTGSAFEYYDDNLEHSIWLSLMKQRLILLRELLSDDGFLCCHIDDSESHYVKVLLDEIFGRSNYLIVEKNGVCGRGGTMLRNMINNIKKSVCKANEDFIFGTDFADKMGWNELDDIRRTNGICDFF